MNMNDPTYVFRIGATLTDMDQYPNRQEYNTQNYDKLKKAAIWNLNFGYVQIKATFDDIKKPLTTTNVK